MTIKKCPQILALFLAFAALASQGQTVHALERQETSVKQAHESDDWFDEDEGVSDIKSNTPTEIDSTVQSYLVMLSLRLRLKKKSQKLQALSKKHCQQSLKKKKRHLLNRLTMRQYKQKRHSLSKAQIVLG